MKREQEHAMVRREAITHTLESQMKRIGLLGLALASLTSAACVDADASLLLTGPVIFGASITEDEGEISAVSCTVSDDGSKAWSRLQINLNEIKESGQSTGRMGLNMTPSVFEMSVLLKNRLVASDAYAPIGEGQNLRLDQNLIQVERVAFRFPEGSNQAGFQALDKEFDFIVSVDSGGGVAGTWVPIITAADLRNWEQVVGAVTGGMGNAVVPGAVEIQVFGRTTSGTEIESNLITVPFDVCLNCTIASTPRCLEEG